MASTGEKSVEDDQVEMRKGILKNRTDDKHHSGVQWDEMNILMTYHPSDKDYGHMKIDEPLTPYSKFKDPIQEGQEGNSEDPISENEAEESDITVKLTEKIAVAPRRKSWEEPPPEADLEDENLTEEEKEEKKVFKKHRQQHYNEFSQVKLARKLIEQELKSLDEDDEDEPDTSSDTKMEQ